MTAPMFLPIIQPFREELGMKSSPSKGGTIDEIVHEIRTPWKGWLCIVELFWIEDPNVSFKIA